MPGKRIVIIDDDQDLREALAEQLELAHRFILLIAKKTHLKMMCIMENV